MKKGRGTTQTGKSATWYSLSNTVITASSKEGLQAGLFANWFDQHNPRRRFFEKGLVFESLNNRSTIHTSRPVQEMKLMICMQRRVANLEESIAPRTKGFPMFHAPSAHCTSHWVRHAVIMMDTNPILTPGNRLCPVTWPDPLAPFLQLLAMHAHRHQVIAKAAARRSSNG